MKFILRNEQILNNAVDYLYALELDEDEPTELILKDHKKLRTEEQHRLYRAWIGIISKETGDSRKALHVFYGDEFLPKETSKAMGKTVEVIKSTTEFWSRPPELTPSNGNAIEDIFFSKYIL